VQDTTGLRGRVAHTLHVRTTSIVKDSMAVYAFAGLQNVGSEDRARLASAVFQLITVSVRDGVVDTTTPGVVEIVHEATEKNVGSLALFSIVYLMERSALDELALDETIGAMSEQWPAIAQMLRRSSFDVCAALADNRKVDRAATPITDSLIESVHTEPVFLAALDKEVQRLERFGHPFALVLLDLDHLRDINAQQGYGAGNRIIERIGIVVRNYFREADWVARMTGGTFAVLLPEINRADAERLADRVRLVVAERLELHDYRSDQRFPVTLSVAVIVVESIERTTRGEQLMTMANEVIQRAKQAGGNRVETQLVPGGQ
jgi:diguanylate cyclase (GGDEF)-like protein